MRRWQLFLIVSLIAVVCFAQSPAPTGSALKISIKELQATLDFFEAPYGVISVDETNTLQVMPKDNINKLKEDYNLQLFYQSWTYYLTSKKLTQETSGIKFIMIKDIGLASIKDLSTYATNKNLTSELLRSYFTVPAKLKK